jgi:uncharacterized membrane protein YqaE (UPF0057 family)
MQQKPSKNAEQANAQLGVRFVIFILVSLAAYALQWDLSNLSWGIWLSEVAICSAVVLNLLRHLFFQNFQSAYLEQGALSTKSSESDFKLRILELGVVGFSAFCILGLLSMYAMFLYVAFPLQVTIRPLSLLNLFLLGAEISMVLLPQHWPMVLGTLILEKQSYTGEDPAKLFHLLGSSDLMKIHLSLMFLPPLALLLQTYTSSYTSVITIILLFIFYFPFSAKNKAMSDDKSTTN